MEKFIERDYKVNDIIENIDKANTFDRADLLQRPKISKQWKSYTASTIIQSKSSECV